MATPSLQIKQEALSGKRIKLPASLRGERLFFSAMAALFVAAVFVGFAQTFYLYSHVAFPAWKKAFAPPHPLIVYVHGTVLSAWFLLLITQTTLIASHNVRLHRRLGIAGFVLACLVVLVSFGTLCEHLARAFSPGDPRIAGHGGGSFTTIFDLVVFAVLVYFGYRYRSNPAAHKRLMLIATVGILPPALARWPVLIHGHFQIALNVTYGLLLLIVIYDILSRKRVHPATFGAGLLYIALRSPAPLALLANNRTWWLHLAIHAQNFGRHLY